MFTGAVATGLFGAIVTLLLGLFDRWQKNRAGNPVVLEAEKAGAAQAQLDVRTQTDEQERETTAAVAGVAQRIDTDDSLRSYEQTDPDNTDNQSNSVGQAGLPKLASDPLQRDDHSTGASS